MKRAHRKIHLLLWLVLGPLMALTLVLALHHRPAEPVNDTLPEALSKAAG